MQAGPATPDAPPDALPIATPPPDAAPPPDAPPVTAPAPTGTATTDGSTTTGTLAAPPPAADATPPAGTPAADAAPTVVVKRVPLRDYGPVAGIELGIGTVTGTPSTVYDSGRGTGLVVGWRQGAFSIAWHFLQSYALSAKDPQLRGDTTLGTLTASSVLVRARVLKAPLLDVMAGPAMLSVPIFIVGEDGVGAQRVEASPMRGVGAIVGAGIGYPLSRHAVISFELRAVVAARWELPGRAYVVPGELAADGGRMYTTASEDATGGAWTATVLLRLMP